METFFLYLGMLAQIGMFVAIALSFAVTVYKK